MNAASTSQILSPNVNHSLNMAGLNRLPSFPIVIVKILDALQDDRMDVARLAALVEMDVVLTARLLTAANSPFYRYGKQVFSIQQAIVSIGWEMVKMLALSAAMIRILSDFTGSKKLDLTRYWHHSLYAAAISKQLAAAAGDVSEDEAYLAGLLHDIGRLALRINFADSYKSIFESLATEESLLPEEVRLFGFDHAEIGAWLVEDWEISSFLHDAIAFHHMPSQQLAQTTQLVKITQLAAAISESYPLVLSVEVANAKKWFDLQPQDLEVLIKKANTQVQALASSLNVDIGLDKLGKDQALVISDESPESATVSSIDIAPAHQANTPVDIDSSIYQSVMKSALIDHVQKVMDVNKKGTEFHTSLLQVAWMLCGSRQVLVFIADMANNQLVGKMMHAQQEWVEKFVFPLEHGVGLISDTFLHQCDMDSFHTKQTDKANMAERQLMRLCHAEGILSVPMHIADKKIGVMVFALDASAAQDLLGKLYVPKSLARIAANYFDPEGSAGEALQETVVAGNNHREEMDKFIHETSNPLSTVKNYLEILRRKLASNPTIDRDLRIVNDEINRVSLLIAQLEESTNRNDAEPVKMDINQTIEDVITLHENTYLKPRRINTSHSLAEGLPEILCVPYKLRQVLINLVKNAAEAMPDGGDLSIASFTEYLPGKKRWVVITVTDTGAGIDDTVKGAIFSAMQSTKGNTNKGLGLSIVAELVASLHGEISFRTVPNVGTSFEIRLPYEHD